MHASLYGKHLSGAERLLDPSVSVEDELSCMLQRALQHPRGRADRINIQVDEIPSAQTVHGQLLNFSGYLVKDWRLGRMLASHLLTEAGVSLQAVSCALEHLSRGAAPDRSSMRGAMLVDAQSGARLEADQARGVRVSRMDLTPEVRLQLLQQLSLLRLDNSHVIEALILASKVISAPGIVAELCWSDDPHYTAGYIASAIGYQRINELKPRGEERGGRAFFVRRNNDDLSPLVDYLQQTPYLINRMGQISPGIPWMR